MEDYYYQPFISYHVEIDTETSITTDDCNNVSLTLLNAVLIWMRLIRISFIGTGDSLNALIEVVFEWSASLGLPALCRLVGDAIQTSSRWT